MATKKVKASDLKESKKNKITLEGMEYDITLDLNALQN